VLNNPLSMTDSSGYFIDWIVAGVYAAVTAVVSAATAGFTIGATIGSMVAGSAGAFVGGIVGGVIGLTAGLLVPTAFIEGASALAIAGNLLYSGYSIGSNINQGAGWGDILRGVGVGFVSAALTFGLAQGGAFDNYFARVVGHGIIRGGENEAMGGRFQDGFLGAASGSLLGSFQILPGWSGSLVSRVLVGGTASVIGGGKFANGAISAAISFLYDGGLLGAEEQKQNQIQGKWIHPYGDASLSEGVTLHSILGTAPESSYQLIANETKRSIFHLYSEGGVSGLSQDVIEVVVDRLTIGLGSGVTRSFIDGFSQLPAGARLDIVAHSQGTAPVTYAMFRRPDLFNGSHFRALSPAVYRAEIALASFISGATFEYSMPHNDIARVYATIDPIGIGCALMNPYDAVLEHIRHGNTLPGFPVKPY
jgi:hypothetical protein